MDLEYQKLSVEWVAIERLFCSPANPRHNDEAVPHVVSSIRRFGWQQPIVARASGEVIAGNTRLKAALEMGLKEVPVAWFDGSTIDATAYQIADNRSHEFADWNEGELALILEQLREEDALEGVGYDDAQIDELLAELAAGSPELNDPGVPTEYPIRALQHPMRRAFEHSSTTWLARHPAPCVIPNDRCARSGGGA